MKRIISAIIATLFLLIPIQIADAQQGSLLNVYLDCDRCDFDFIRREIEYVNYVRDPSDSDIHIIVTRQSSGNGSVYLFRFIDISDPTSNDQLHSYDEAQTNTADETRRGIAKIIAIGLLPHLSDTSSFSSLSVVYTPSEDSVSTSTEDPWNKWVFNVGGSGSFNGQQRRTSRSFSFSGVASRTTEQWKMNSHARGSFRTDNFVLNDGSVLSDVRNDYFASSSLVKSLGDHWGGRVSGRVNSSTFNNISRSFGGDAGIEYNIFPYTQSSERSLTFAYSIGAFHNSYEEETVFDLLDELRPQGIFRTELDAKQTWGQAGLTVTLSNYLNELPLYRVSFLGSISYRITRGLSFDTFASLWSIHDQISLSKSGLTDEEILLRRRELGTSFRYSVNFGVSYTFGSIFNNIVNPRFGRGH